MKWAFRGPNSMLSQDGISYERLSRRAGEDMRSGRGLGPTSLRGSRTWWLPREVTTPRVIKGGIHVSRRSPQEVRANLPALFLLVGLADHSSTIPGLGILLAGDNRFLISAYQRSHQCWSVVFYWPLDEQCYNILMAEVKETKKSALLFQNNVRSPKKIRAITLLTTEEVAERLRLRRDTVLDYIRQGKIKAVRFNKRIYRIQEKDLERFIKQCQKK